MTARKGSQTLAFGLQLSCSFPALKTTVADGYFFGRGQEDFVGNLFRVRSSGDLQLENLQFNFDPHGTAATSGYGTRIVQNAGSLSVSDCSFIGTQSAADQAYLLGHAVGTKEKCI